MARILVVDDDIQVLGLIKLVLSSSGYEVASASDGREVLRLVAESPPDLVITDLHMPETDGFVILREMRRLEPRIPLIAISGGGRYSDLLAPCLRMAKGLGAVSLLTKPFGATELLEAVHRALVAKRLSPAPGS